MNVLVCWSEVPDETAFIILENLPPDVGNKVVAFNGKYINASDDETLGDFFFDDAGELRFEKIPGPIIGGKFDAVINTGIIL